MSSPRSFYLPKDQWRAPFALEGGEARHLVKVLRIKPGETVRLFDGQGTHGLFSVRETGKSRVVLEQRSQEFSPRPPVRCTLAAGFSKALRRGWFMEKAVELEADALWLWQGDYSQASLPGEEKESWKASLIAGAKQCENPWLPGLSLLPGGAADIAGRAGDFDRAFLLYEGDTHGRMLASEDLGAPGAVLLVIGPEGGFSPREVSLLQEAGLVAVSMGNRILRWETAAVLALGLAWWSRQ